MNGKELAKFFAGFAANQLLTHGALAVSGMRFSILGINYDQQANAIAAVVWGIISLLLIYYSWGRK